MKRQLKFEDWFNQFPALVRKAYWESWLVKQVMAECFAFKLEVQDALCALQNRGALAACGLVLRPSHAQP